MDQRGATVAALDLPPRAVALEVQHPAAAVRRVHRYDSDLPTAIEGRDVADLDESDVAVRRVDRVGAGVRAEIPAAVADRGQRIGDLARRAVHEGELRPRLRELAAVLLARVQQPARGERVVGHAVAVELAGRRGGRELVLVGKDLAVRDRESPQLAPAERDQRDLDGRGVQALAVKRAVGAAVSIGVGEHAADLLRCGTEVVGAVHGGLRRGARGQEERERYARSEWE